MRNVQGRDKITVLILLAASTMVGVLAADIGPSGDAAESAGASNRLLLAAAFACSLIAVLMLLSPGKSHRSLPATLRDNWPQLAGLVILVITYALILEKLGFFLATALFLIVGNFLLGERRWLPLFALSVPVAAALQLMMHGLFGVAVTDPLMRALGVIA